MILVVCAVGRELDWMNSRAGVELLTTGVGPVDAAAKVARALALKKYEVVINAGIAGAMPGVANVGDAVVVGEEMMPLELETGESLILPPASVLFNRVSADAALSETITALGFPLVRGITVSQVTSTDTTAIKLQARGAEIESMEGFAVLRAAQLAGVSAVEVRGISNIVGDRKKSGWDFDAGLSGLRRVLNATLDLLHTSPANAD